MFAKFDEFPSLPFQDIMEKNITDRRKDGRMDNMKTVNTPTNGYNEMIFVLFVQLFLFWEWGGGGDQLFR